MLTDTVSDIASASHLSDAEGGGETYQMPFSHMSVLFMRSVPFRHDA